MKYTDEKPWNILMENHEIYWWKTMKYTDGKPWNILMENHEICWWKTMKYTDGKPWNILMENQVQKRGGDKPVNRIANLPILISWISNHNTDINPQWKKTMHRFASTQIKILTMNIYLNKHQIWKWYWIEVNNLSALLTFMKLFLRNMYICICFRTTSNHIHGVKLEIRKVSTHIFPCKVILKNNHECDRNLVLYTLSPCLWRNEIWYPIPQMI